MKIVNIVLDDDIIVTYQKENDEYETYQYSFIGYPSGELAAHISAPKLPEWVIGFAGSHMNNNHVVIVQFSKIDEDDFEYLLNRRTSEGLNKLIKGAIFTDIHPGRIFDYMEDFIGTENA